MPNRLVREGLLESEAVLSLPVEARWLFIAILLSADDVGLFEATAFRLARKADIQRDVVDKLLQMLADVDLVRLYVVDGKRFGFIPRFGQRLQIKRIKHSLPPDELLMGDEDAIKKINGLISKTTVMRGCVADEQQKTTAAQPPEPEPEPEPKSKSKTSAISKIVGPHNAPPKASPPAKRGTRLPNEWQLTAPLEQFAREECPHWSAEKIAKVAAKFKDHWLSANGQRGIKADWEATWRNWVRNEAQTHGVSRAPPQSGRAARIDSYAEQAAMARAKLEATDGFDEDGRIIDGRAKRVA